MALSRIKMTGKIVEREIVMFNHPTLHLESHQQG